jgi:hypothetical protein
MPDDGHIDWEAGERHFVTTTSPRVWYREYASKSSEYAWTNYTEVSHHKIRDMARNGLWAKKRNEYLQEQHPGMLTDLEIVYGVLLRYAVDVPETMSAGEAARVAGELVRVSGLILEMKPRDDDEDHDRVLTRDDVLQILNDETPLTNSELMEKAMEAIT